MAKLYQRIDIVSLNLAALIAIFVLFQTNEALRTGAPALACINLRPFHGLHRSRPASASQFFVLQSSFTYEPGQNVTVNITTHSSERYFRGFIIQAYDPTTGTQIGHFLSSADSRPIDSCSASTHRNNLNKKHISLTWLPPASSSINSLSLNHSSPPDSPTNQWFGLRNSNSPVQPVFSFNVNNQKRQLFLGSFNGEKLRNFANENPIKKSSTSDEPDSSELSDYVKRELSGPSEAHDAEHLDIYSGSKDNNERGPGLDKAQNNEEVLIKPTPTMQGEIGPIGSGDSNNDFPKPHLVSPAIETPSLPKELPRGFVYHRQKRQADAVANNQTVSGNNMQGIGVNQVSGMRIDSTINNSLKNVRFRATIVVTYEEFYTGYESSDQRFDKFDYAQPASA